MKLEKLQNRIGYQFGDRGVLLQALTHTSYGHEFLSDRPIAHRDNERLEFLGDAILDGVVSDLLLEIFPKFNEGQLSKMRAAVVNEKTLAQVALSIGLHEVVRLGKGETQSRGNLKPSILSSTFEALIAAIYLDGGFLAVYPVVRHLFSRLFSEDEDSFVQQDYKTQLQEKLQATHRQTPTYHLIKTTGPDHAKSFEIEARIGDVALARATGSSKKDAEQNAARAAITSLKKEST
jgi:ribonuclease-3